MRCLSSWPDPREVQTIQRPIETGETTLVPVLTQFRQELHADVTPRRPPPQQLGVIGRQAGDGLGGPGALGQVVSHPIALDRPVRRFRRKSCAMRLVLQPCAARRLTSAKRCSRGVGVGGRGRGSRRVGAGGAGGGASWVDGRGVWDGVSVTVSHQLAVSPVLPVLVGTAETDRGRWRGRRHAGLPDAVREPPG